MSKLDTRRVVDIAVASVGFIVFAVPIAVMAAVATCESGKPGLFRETRYGLNGKPFRIWKVRTRDESRTPYRICGLLRKVEMDELPQFVNVLRGDMSIIGPRPIDRIFNIPEWTHMLSIKPGMTGPATVMSKERDTDLNPEAIAAFNSSYINQRLAANTCMKADIDIILRSLKIIVSGRGDVRQAAERAKVSALQHY